MLFLFGKLCCCDGLPPAEEDSHCLIKCAFLLAFVEEDSFMYLPSVEEDTAILDLC